MPSGLWHEACPRLVLPEGKQVQGKIKSLDQSKQTLTLEDGTKLTLTNSIKVPPSALKKGTMITATYKEQGGQKVVTSIEVLPPSKS